ncbi:MAG: RluA family pseudouridine synthase [Planctomycetes bacterium]|nr:RluA family pseudouridine synthase [Planctomycetota bacterium]MCB9910754.1 RluA family pseudouridine synthase [Planctomycetota bacterium]MCB9912780.1 RluA family pseudouridine synthase [Planctomycetota bacterium]HPF14290.1 RluA family pseudouridine synthase [Planctomycetota bacterium]HRV80871.1 RluA family pseudouridine synthase [Planctomycetota bacterium]
MVTYFPVPEERVGLELDEFLCLLYPGASKGFLRSAIRDGDIEIVGKDALVARHLKAQDVICVHLEEHEIPRQRSTSKIELNILFEDDRVLVVDKPPGIAVEPERWDLEAPCVSGLLLDMAARRSEGGDPAFRPRLVHRIDKDTSGALLVAKDLDAERELRQAFEAHRIQKVYWALVDGEFPAEPGERVRIDLALAPEPKKVGRMRVVASRGRASQTDVWVEQRFRGFTLVGCAPITGRTHQIRVHLAHEGFPLAVDPFYGRRDQLLLSEIKAGYRHKQGASERPLMPRLTLHAHSIAWPRPGVDGDVFDRAEAPLPKDFASTLKQLAKVRPPA